MMTKEQDTIVKIMIDRKYKDIPTWMLCLLNDDGFELLATSILDMLKNMGSYIDYEDDRLRQVQSLLSRIKQIGHVRNITIWKILNQLDSGVLPFASLLLETSGEWKRFLRGTNMKAYIEYSMFSTNDILSSLLIQYHSNHKTRISKILLKTLLKNWDKKLAKDVANMKNIRYDADNFLRQLYVYQTDKNTPTDFSGFVWEIIWSYHSIYPWIELCFSIERCWSFGISYYPFEHEDWIYTYLKHMHDYCYSCILPRDIYIHLEKFIKDDYVSANYKAELRHWIEDMVLFNANNLLFLCPFRYTATKSQYDACISKFQFSTSEYPLRNYKDFCLFAGERSKNYLLQKDFIKNGGDPCTLIDVEYSIVFTIKGICTVLQYSSAKDIADLLSHKDIRQILMERYITEGYTPGRTNRLLTALGKYPSEENIDLYYWVRSNLVDLSSIHENTNTVICRVLPLSFEESRNILDKCPDALQHIPCGRIDFQQLMHILNGKHCYVPLYYGYLFINGDFVKGKYGIENYLESRQLFDLVRSFPVYLADVQSDTMGIIALNLMCI